VTGEVVESIQDRLRRARVVLHAADPAAGAILLREAKLAAGMPADEVAETSTFQAVLDVRNELGCCLLAAERLEEAGVERRVVVDILDRGAAAAEGILGRLAETLERC
jgi:hypothetical protein